MSSFSASHTDGGLLGIGEQCSWSTCNLIDFLPFACTHCKSKYCLDHFQPTAHSCPKYDSAADDRVAPDCPLCFTPVAFPLGTDPNARMERHFAEECTAMGHTKKTTGGMPVCAGKQCNKKLVQPIPCADCKQKFCPEHRFASSHDCQPVVAAVTPARASPFSAARPGPQASAALAAMKRRVAATAKQAKDSATTAIKSAQTARSTPTTPARAPSTGAPAPQPAPQVAGNGSGGTEGKKMRNPFSKTDRCEPLPSALTSTPTVASSLPSPAPAIPQSSPSAVVNAMTPPTALVARFDPLLGSWAPPSIFVSA